MKLRFGIATRRVARRVAAVDAYEFPSSVRQRLRLKHPGLGIESTARVEAALRQWFRILARRPKAQLAMPSTLVDDMWHELMLHTRDYAAFCDTAFGRFLHHEPEAAMTPDQVAANRSVRLLATLWLARADENCAPDALPLLFRVDQEEVGLEGVRRYVADCGGRGECYDNANPNLVCLQHLTGVKRPLPGRSRGNASWQIYGFGAGSSGGGGCGSGGGSSGGGGGCGGGGGG